MGPIDLVHTIDARPWGSADACAHTCSANALSGPTRPGVFDIDRQRSRGASRDGQAQSDGARRAPTVLLSPAKNTERNLAVVLRRRLSRR